MKALLIYAGVLMCLFITPTTATHWGIKQQGTAAFAVLLLLAIYEVFVRTKVLVKLRPTEEYLLMILFVAYSMILVIIRDSESIQSFFFFIFTPICCSLVIRMQDKKITDNILKIVLFFFFAECFLAFYERSFKVNVFPTEIFDKNAPLSEDDYLFRSSAFLGHPLNNALCVSIMLGFIITSKFSDLFKILCLGTGFLSLLCFNARGATIVWAAITFYFLFSLVRSNRKNVAFKIILFLFVISFIAGTTFIILKTSLGGRVTNSKLLDGSALTRLNVFNAFDYLTGSDLWFGSQKNYLLITGLLHAGGVENSYISIIINYGLFGGITVIVLLFFLVKKLLAVYETRDRIIILISFILVGSLNNSLSGNTPWIIFLFCVSVFPVTNKSKLFLVKQMPIPETQNKVTSDSIYDSITSPRKPSFK